MKTFVAVVQVSANKFDVEKVNAESARDAKTKGMMITVFESNTQNDKYCFQIADDMNKKSIDNQ